MEWEHLFRSHILERGYDYYLEDRVCNLRYSDQKIEAVVEGSEDYEVKILLSDGEISHMSCSCPYAADGTPCKHMAAVLCEYDVALEEDGAEDDEKPEKSDKAAGSGSSMELTLDEMVANADSELIRRFLIETLRHDEKLALRFRSLCSSVVSAEDMEKYKKRINQLIRRYQGRGGFIDYHSARSFMSEMIGEMNDSLENLFDNQCYEEAFELAAYTFIQVSGVEMDDSDGELSWFAEECNQWWERILEEAEKTGQTKVQEKMFEWFSGHLDGSIIDYMEENVEGFLKSHFNTGDYQKKKLAVVDIKIEEYGLQETGKYFDYHLEGWLLTRLKMMEEMGSSWDELKAFCEQHWNQRGIRNWYARACANRGEKDEEISTLEQSLRMDESYAGLVSEYCLRLKELYKDTGRIQDYQKMMWRIVTQIKPGDLTLFREFKEQYGKDGWPEMREKVFKALSMQPFALMELYREEELYDRLIKVVLSANGLHAARTYQKELLPLYPNEYLEKYTEEAERSALRVANRQHYRELANLLIEIRKIPGGQQKSEEIEKHWRDFYGNRRAMMDELNQMHRRQNPK